MSRNSDHQMFGTVDQNKQGDRPYSDTTTRCERVTVLPFHLAAAVLRPSPGLILPTDVLHRFPLRECSLHS